MNTENTAITDHQNQLAQLLQLRQAGVVVAEGNGTFLERSLVLVTIVYSLFAFGKMSFAGSAFYLMLPMVILAIDFLSGFVHWFFDTQVKPADTFLGRIAVDFLDHHVRPGRTAQVGFFASAWRPALMVTLPLVSIASLLPMPAIATAIVFWIGFLSMLVPQTHKEAHLGVRPVPISWMQKSRLILYPESHLAHHTNNSQSFCVFTGWLNPLLDRTRFWRGLEWLFDKVRGR